MAPLAGTVDSVDNAQSGEHTKLSLQSLFLKSDCEDMGLRILERMKRFPPLFLAKCQNTRRDPKTSTTSTRWSGDVNTYLQIDSVPVVTAFSDPAALYRNFGECAWYPKRS